MKKIQAILKDKYNEQLLDIQEKKIQAGIECAILNAQEQGLDAQIEIEKLKKKLGDPDVAMHYVLENMKEQDDIIIASEEMVDFLEKLNIELNSEV